VLHSTFCGVPVQVNIHGNKAADILAKGGSHQPRPNLPVSYSKDKTLLKSSLRGSEQLEKQKWRL